MEYVQAVVRDVDEPVMMNLLVIQVMGYFYLTFALVLSGILVYMAVRLVRDTSKEWERSLFWYLIGALIKQVSNKG